MMTLFKSLVRCKVEYCCPLWNPSKITDIQTIENIQRQFTRKIAGLNQMDYWERLRKLKLYYLYSDEENSILLSIHGK